MSGARISRSNGYVAMCGDGFMKMFSVRRQAEDASQKTVGYIWIPMAAGSPHFEAEDDVKLSADDLLEISLEMKDVEEKNS